MTHRCGSCGMDNPDGALMCDFCKAVLKKAAPKLAAAPPDDARARSLIGQVEQLFARSDVDGALVAARRALHEIEPRLGPHAAAVGELYAHVAYLFFLKEQTDQAMSHARRALETLGQAVSERDERLARPLQVLGCTQVGSGHLAEAIANLQRAAGLARNPRLRVEILVGLGEALVKARRPGEARDALASAVALGEQVPDGGPMFAYALELMARLDASASDPRPEQATYLGELTAAEAQRVLGAAPTREPALAGIRIAVPERWRAMGAQGRDHLYEASPWHLVLRSHLATAALDAGALAGYEHDLRSFSADRGFVESCRLEPGFGVAGVVRRIPDGDGWSCALLALAVARTTALGIQIHGPEGPDAGERMRTCFTQLRAGLRITEAPVPLPSSRMHSPAGFLFEAPAGYVPSDQGIHLLVRTGLDVCRSLAVAVEPGHPRGGRSVQGAEQLIRALMVADQLNILTEPSAQPATFGARSGFLVRARRGLAVDPWLVVGACVPWKDHAIAIVASAPAHDEERTVAAVTATTISLRANR